MARYIIKRLLWLVVIMAAVSILIFTIMYFVPGDSALIVLGPESTVVERNEWREIWGLNDPYLKQLFRYLYQTFFQFDLGTSYVNNVPRGSVLILAAFSAVAVLLVDITYGLIDPRIKAQYISFAARKRGEKS